MTSSDSGDESAAIERRLASVEGEAARLREEVTLASADAGAARVLSAGADRDVSEVRAELRAHSRVLNALRETQIELRESQVEQGRQIAGLDRKMTDGFAMLTVGMQHVVVLIEGLGQGDASSPA